MSSVASSPAASAYSFAYGDYDSRYRALMKAIRGALPDGVSVRVSKDLKGTPTFIIVRSSKTDVAGFVQYVLSSKPGQNTASVFILRGTKDLVRKLIGVFDTFTSLHSFTDSMGIRGECYALFTIVNRGLEETASDKFSRLKEERKRLRRSS